MPADTELITGIVRATHEAGQALAKRAGRTPARTMREFRSVFTEADGVALDILRPQLSSLRPGAPRWGDELDTVVTGGEQWLVDAIDGAVQYLQDLPQWSVSATLLRDGQPAVAVLHNPGLAETYIGVAACGLAPPATARRSPRRPRPTCRSPCSRPASPPSPAETPRPFAAPARLLASVLLVAGAVSGNLGPTSPGRSPTRPAGRLDGFWEFGLDDGNAPRLFAAPRIARGSRLRPSPTATAAPGHPAADSIIVAPPHLHPAHPPRRRHPPLNQPPFFSNGPVANPIQPALTAEGRRGWRRRSASRASSVLTMTSSLRL